MNISRFTALFLGLATVASAQSVLTYTEAGGNISGSLNGVAFNNATWSISATADSSLATHYSTGDLGGDIWVGVWALFTTPTLTITDGTTVLTAALPGWDIESRNYSEFSPGMAAIMFSNASADGNTGVEQGSAAYITGNSSAYTDLQTIGVFTGPSGFDGHTYATSAGNLFVSHSSDQPGTFTIAPAAVPEPSALALAAGGFGLLALFRRARH